MKHLIGLTLAVAVATATGCASHKKSMASVPVLTQTKPSQTIITPDNSLAASVLTYNPENRFVVLNFPSGDVPKRDEVMFVYHGGLKAGEVKITGPQHDNNVVADLTSGTAQSGDEVRDQ